MVQFFCFLLSFFSVQRPGGRGLGGRVQSGDDLSVACGDSSPSQGEPRGVRRSQCLPLLRGGAERSEAERFRRAAAAGMTSQALRASSPLQGEPRGVRRSQCLPLLRGGAERSEAERFRRVAAAGRPLRRCAPAPLRKGSQGAYRNFLLQFLQKEKRGYPLLAVHGADDVANTTCALILAQLAVKRKKFYWNLTFFDFSWYMSHGI